MRRLRRSGAVHLVARLVHVGGLDDACVEDVLPVHGDGRSV
jgi:hypothetical protein